VTSPSQPAFWRALSTALLVLFAVSFLVSGFSVPAWGWIALLLSGVTFGVEVLLIVGQRSGRR
jgi:hypothetical protein